MTIPGENTNLLPNVRVRTCAAPPKLQLQSGRSLLAH